MSKNKTELGSNSPQESNTGLNCNATLQDPPMQPNKEDLKLIEAKTAVILLKNSRLCTTNEYTQWLLKLLYQPYSRKDGEGSTDFLYLSRSRRKIWTSDFSINQDPSRVEATVNRHMDQLYVITPKTSIMTLSQENRLVYIIDLSSSLATVGNTKSDILLSEVFQVLKNSLEGLVQPFSMQVSPTEKVVVQPLLYLTVMADCSQFASNVNIIPMLAEHPTMRVFLQDVNITANNIYSIIQKLKSEFLSFQKDTNKFRKAMKRNRSDMGYNLDVGNEVAPLGTTVGTLDAASFSKQKSKLRSSESIHTAQENYQQSNRNTPTTTGSDPEISQKTKDTTSYYSSKKEVWGIGKSGANLSRILHAGHFAFKLLSRQGRAQLILITDGAMKSNVHDNTFVRRFAEEDITCHIIQIGYSSSFLPGRNFGFVPDTEILQFLVRATSGTFMYSENCLTKSCDHEFSYNEDEQPTATATNENKKIQHPIVQFIDINKAKHISKPNIYHRKFLFKETVLTRLHHLESKLQAEKELSMPGGNLDVVSNELSRDRYNFPWDPHAKAPEGEWRLLKYREYPLPAEFSHIIAARARDGFTLQSVTFEDGNGSKNAHSAGGIQNLEASDFTAVRKERIQIVMVMRWQPNISIEYRIRATWLPTVIGCSSSSYKSEDLLMSSSIFSRGKAPRAEIYVRTDASFAHTLQNWDVFRRRAQMMGAVTGSISFGEAFAAPVYSKIEKLKSYLVDIYEGDEVLKSVIGFPNKFWVNKTPGSSGSNHSGHDSNGGSLSSSLRMESYSNVGFTPQLAMSHLKPSFIEAFKTFWERINISETRARTKCWYDTECIDLLVGDVSPYMTPNLESSYNQDFIYNVEEVILFMIENVKIVMKGWSDFEAADGTFIKMMHRPISISSSFAPADEQTRDYFTPSFRYPPSFCELRVRHEYGRLVTLRLLFFNADIIARRRTLDHLRHLLKLAPETKASCNMICERPFSYLLMRDPDHYTDPASATAPGFETPNNDRITPVGGDLIKNQSRAKAWYLPVAMWLTSEYIVRDYLHHMTWEWQTDNNQDSYHRGNKMMPIHDLAFQFLCQARLDQGYQLVSPRQNKTQFYQEISLPHRDGKQSSLCAIQYFAWKDSATGKITTELWMEPSGNFDFDQYELVKKWTFEPDKKTISQLVTFDQIHAIGQAKAIGNFKDKRNASISSVGIPDEGATFMMLPQLFDVASVLKSNRFVIASFQLPQYKMMILPSSNNPNQPPTIRTNNTPSSSHHDDLSLPENNNNSDYSNFSTPIIKGGKGTPHIKTHRYVRRHVASTPNFEIATESPVPSDTQQNLLKFKPDSLLDKNKKRIAKMNTRLQNYSILHYFIEKYLDYLSNGEIIVSHHDIGASFWQDLKNALRSISKDGERPSTSTGLIPDLCKTRCFVKVFDPRSFVVILFPSLDTVSNSLLKLQKESASEGRSIIEKCKFLDVFMFECTRQKPMKPTRSDFLFTSPLEEANRTRIENILDDAGKISIKSVPYLIHESDGLGAMLRPELFVGKYTSTCQSQAQLSDRVLRVAQDVGKLYSKSFLKSFYTCLIRGFVVDDEDLGKALEVCNESTMEIDITEFVNAMAMQKHGDNMERELQEADVQAKYNSIFGRYFEKVHAKNESKSNLFYYKPPFCRNIRRSSRQTNLSSEEKVSNVVDIVGYSHAPLLVKLFCAYRTTSLQDSEDPSCTEIIVPVGTLPTYLVNHKNGDEESDLEEKNIAEDNLPSLNTGDTKVALQVVCLNMSRVDLDKYITEDSAFSSASEALIESMKNQPECFLSLTRDQQLALAETESRIRWLLKEETMHSLLKSPIIDLNTLKYVQEQLASPNPYINYQTSVTIPLEFVKNYAESRAVFMDELEKDGCCKKSGRYRLKRIDDYFYVSEDYIYNMCEELSYSNGGSPVVSSRNNSVHNIDINTTPTTSALHDEFCDGLGISLTQFAEKEAGEEEVNLRNEASTSLDRRPLYWLILIPHERHVQIYFYSKIQMLASSFDILNSIKEKVKMIQECTNRLLLLSYLQNARICSKYLEAPSNEESGKIYSDEDESEEENTSEGIPDVFGIDGVQVKPVLECSTFFPSQFHCPIVFTKRFPLHWRLQPNVAIKFLKAEVLRLFTVINRPNMFVIERDGSIVYCKIYEETIGGGLENGSPGTVCGSPAATVPGKPIYDDAQTLIGITGTNIVTAKKDLPRVPSTSPRPEQTTTNTKLSIHEKRVLVLEVYGIDLPPWIEKEFVNLIDNRITSQITLNEIQQYFARNSTSKPTEADVEFILPTEKPPTHRELLRVPSLANSPYTLMQYFKQSLLADNIRPLSGPFVKDIVERYYNNAFFAQVSDAVQDGATREDASRSEKVFGIPAGSFCFYYNCTNRLPGSSSALELLAGQGVAGICLTLLDETGVPITNIKDQGKSGANFDPGAIHDCLEEEFREGTSDSTFFHIWVDVWVTGSVDGNALLQHIYECYRQSLCDYFIEITVTIDLGAALSMDGALQKAVAKRNGHLGTILRKKFIESVLFILRKASELKSPTVYSVEKDIHSTPSCMDDLVRYLDVELRKMNPLLRPTVAWTPIGNDIWDERDGFPNTGSKWELYRGFEYRQNQKLQSNTRLVAISGLDEFVEKLGSVSGPFAQKRRVSSTSDLGSWTERSRRSSGGSANTDGGQNVSKNGAQDYSIESSSLSSPTTLNKSGPHVDTTKHCFMIMTLDSRRLEIYTYNWSESVSHDLFNKIVHVANRQEARNEIMSNILHQKMGLFHHTESIRGVMENLCTASQNAPTLGKSLSINSTPNTSFGGSTPKVTLNSPNAAKKPRQLDNATKQEPSTPSIRIPGTSVRRNYQQSSAPSPAPAVANMLYLKDMITFPTISPVREPLESASKHDESVSSPSVRQIEKEKYLDRILQKSVIEDTELDRALMDCITDSVADTNFSKDLDILRRHGQLFLETFLRRTKVQSAHRKALKVYLKWRKRYGDPSTCEMNSTEKLSRLEVSTIMRSSRVLHFCRTPLIFCDPEKDWSNLAEGSTNRTNVIEWFKNMGSLIISEYANYLEGADMQLIDFAKSDNDNVDDSTEETNHRPSEFSLGKHMTAECPPTYLLRVFEGGSIICEVRLTSVFVSVTLYTLHRQYGRLDYNRFRHETHIKRRSNFKRFEESSGRFKQMIHINSFVYDFQLHYLQKMLDSPEKLPAELDALSFVRRFARINQNPSPYSKDRIIHGFYQFEMANIDSKTFFHNMFKNAPHHGLRNVMANNTYSAVSASSFDLCFDWNKSSEVLKSDWKYTIVACPAAIRPENEPHEVNSHSNTHRIAIEYFILVVYQDQIMPERMTTFNWKGSESSQRRRCLYDATLSEERHTLADVVSSARNRLDNIVSEVIVHSKRVENWKKLYFADLSISKNVRSIPEHPELVQLMNKFDRVDITEADRDMKTIFSMNLDWNSALNTVKSLMKSSSKDFQEGGRRHVLLYSARYMDFMIHLRIDSGKDIQGWIVSRDKRANRTAFEGAEREQLTSLGKVFYYHMWRNITDLPNIKV